MNTDYYNTFYAQSLALLTDLYQLTMSFGYWKMGLEKKESVFHLFFRKKPFQGGFAIAAGLEHAIQYLNRFHFDPADLAYLESLKMVNNSPLFPAEFLDYLAKMKFTCSVDAIPEGTVVFPYEPLLRIQGPLIQCQLLETPLLALMNFPTLIATKAARICLSAQGEPVLEFGLRRAQGIDGGLTASRSAYIGGCDSTSNVLAGKLFGIPVKGTHSHSWVMTFDEELESFETYAKALPDNCIFLVDTYDTLEGVKKAIQVGLKLKVQGKKMLGVRLDSGDLAYLSIAARKLLDEAGLHDAKVVASNELDETLIGELKRQGSKISIWGVGTKLVTGHGQPALDGVYKLSAIRDPGEKWKYKLKLSEQMAKISNPGILQVRRYYDDTGNVADAIYDVQLGIQKKAVIVDPLDPTRQKITKGDLKYQDLLLPIFREGRCVYTPPPLDEIRKKTQNELSKFHPGIKRFLNPHEYVVGMLQNLNELKLNLIKSIRTQMISEQEETT